jgi:hypothetical protein
MIMLTMHALFLTSTQKFNLSIYTRHNQLSWAQPLALKGERKNSLTWNTDVLLMVANPHPL